MSTSVHFHTAAGPSPASTRSRARSPPLIATSFAKTGRHVNAAARFPAEATIHDTEWDLLEVLWTKERGTAREVTEALAKKRGWAVSTVKTLLDRMVQKGLVSARQVGNVWEYTAAVRPVDARRSPWAELVEKAFGGSVAPALHCLARDAKLSKREIAELRALHRRKGEGP